MSFSDFLCPSFFITLLYFFNDTPTTEIYTLSLHDALPISFPLKASISTAAEVRGAIRSVTAFFPNSARARRSEEHTSELQSRQYLVCRLLLEKKKKHIDIINISKHES